MMSTSTIPATATVKFISREALRAEAVELGIEVGRWGAPRLRTEIAKAKAAKGE